MAENWSISSWQSKEIKQQPDWPDKAELNNVLKRLSGLPSLVFSGETRQLKEELCKVSKGKSFILQAGNCAESFEECNGPEIHNYLRIMAVMKDIIEEASGKEVVSIGRVAGQYAKPRSSKTEIINGNEIPVYRGDNINSIEPSLKKRKPDSKRLLKGYFSSVATLNLIRAFVQGRYTEGDYRFDWQAFPYSDKIKSNDAYRNYLDQLKEINSSKEFRNFYVSHEALLLNYEQAFTRLDTTKGGYYNTAAHFLWVGDRTRQLNSAHVEYLRGIGNPIGVKIGPGSDPIEISKLVELLNPKKSEGRIVLILRYGQNFIEKDFPQLIQQIKGNGQNVIWMIDPMHGNTFKIGETKVRDFNQILDEIKVFFKICKREKIVPGGVHLEITSNLVTECIGGINGIRQEDLKLNYQTKVDPRLNGAQAIELGMKISKLF